jgi:hypothetical protein
MNLCHRRQSQDQSKVIVKLYQEITPENSPNLGKEMDIQVHEAFRTQNKQEKMFHFTL